MKELSWTPVRRGAIYCAPACGSDCTWAAHQEALRKATALCRRLGPLWSPTVFENMGWHYRATFGRPRAGLHEASLANVSENRDGMCTAYIDGDRYVGESRSPQEAVQLAVSAVRQKFLDVWAVLDHMRVATAVFAPKSSSTIKRRPPAHRGNRPRRTTPCKS